MTYIVVTVKIQIFQQMCFWSCEILCLTVRPFLRTDASVKCHRPGMQTKARAERASPQEEGRQMLKNAFDKLDNGDYSFY
jgi:hypothetical protein